MTDPKWYVHKPEVWDQKKCFRLARRTVTDGMGTKHWRRGYIGDHYGYQRYNGGFSPHSGPFEHTYFTHGEVYPLPIIAPGFRIIRILNWGYYIEKADTNQTK